MIFARRLELHCLRLWLWLATVLLEVRVMVVV